RAHRHDFTVSNQQSHLALPQESHHPHWLVSVNINSHLLAIFFHLLPVFGYFPLRLGELRPGYRRPSGWLLNHLNAVFDRTNVVAETTAHAIRLTYKEARARVHGFFFAVCRNIVSLRVGQPRV